MAIEWFEADADQAQLDLLVPYDHYRVRIDDRDAVLITYLLGQADGRPSLGPALLAVRHSAVAAYPPLPATVADLVGPLAWRAIASPTGR